jgi:hypothetical protein
VIWIGAVERFFACEMGKTAAGGSGLGDKERRRRLVVGTGGGEGRVTVSLMS